MAGCPAVLAVLTEKLGAGAGDMQLLDGSGLSYDNRASAEYLVNLLDGMHHGPLAKIYADSLKEARVLLGEKKFSAAITVLDRLITERPREPQARFLRGVALSDSGKSTEAVLAFQALLGEYPELPEPRNNLAVLYAQKGEYALARDQLEAAIAAAPDYTIAYENLGDLYARMAAIQYEKVLARDARNRSAPVKLKLVRDALAPPATPAPAPAAATEAPSTPAPSTAAPR